MWAPEETEDAWNWWQKRKGNLRNFALGMLVAPASSAGTERGFKSRANVHTPKRSRLGNTKVVNCVRAKAYLKDQFPKPRRRRKHTLISAVEPPRPIQSPEVGAFEEEIDEDDENYALLDYVSLDGEEFFIGDPPDGSSLARDVPNFAEFQAPSAPPNTPAHDVQYGELSMSDLWGPS